MRIMYINNVGGGFADYMNIEDSTNIEKLFKQKMPHEETQDYLIRVNRLIQAVSASVWSVSVERHCPAHTRPVINHPAYVPFVLVQAPVPEAIADF